MSESEDEKENPKSKTSKKSSRNKEPETFIRESEDMIVDLADPNELSKAICMIFDIFSQTFYFNLIF